MESELHDIYQAVKDGAEKLRVAVASDPALRVFSDMEKTRLQRVEESMRSTLNVLEDELGIKDAMAQGAARKAAESGEQSSSAKDNLPTPEEQTTASTETTETVAPQTPPAVPEPTNPTPAVTPTDATEQKASS